MAKQLNIPQRDKEYIQLQNRRYIGNKYKLIEWIFSLIDTECEKGKTFADIFAGTGVVSAMAAKHFDKIILNDFLYSNYAIYQAFFGKGKWDRDKTENIIDNYNNIDSKDLKDNYFSKWFGGKYFSLSSSKIIGFVREDIEKNRKNLTDKEYHILIVSLLYSIDKIANTVGHYDAYFKKANIEDRFFMRLIEPISVKNVSIYREDTNQLAKKIKADVVYIDPPYNSRQYSRFYHVLETLTKWDKPELHGTALKPDPENTSDYCRVHAKNRLAELIKNLDAKYLVISYNNTYNSKSKSSKNKITLQEIKNILTAKGKTKVFEKSYRHFNAGNTEFKDHKEYLFVTKVGL
jgi:Adenine-specific DNA methylase